MRKKIIAALVAAAVAVSAAGCGGEDVRTDKVEKLSYDDAVEEIDALMSKVKPKKVKDPEMDIYSDETSEADALADIETFPMVVRGNGVIDIEIAGSTEMTSEESPDNFLVQMAEDFNKKKYEINGDTVSVSIRKMASGEVLTYMEAEAYRPDAYVPSAYMWGEMLKATGVGVEDVTDRIAGNTAGILMKMDVYNDFIAKYKEATLENILTAAINKDILFAYTNPYTSTTGLNGVASMLAAFDSTDPLSSKAAAELLEYQKTSPPVAYTTAVLRNQAAKGVIDTMLMEEQAYINTPELRDYKYIPFGIRHDHPVYTFDYCTEEEKEAVKMFAEFCQTDENQKIASEKGFNRNEDYKSQDPGINGTGWISAQKVWKDSKNGGKPIITVFVTDVSGSMDGEPLNSLKQSLVSASSYISSSNYVGLVSFDDKVTINLPIEKFDAKQRAYFTGEVKNLSAGGGTATYDGILTAMQMLVEKSKTIPDAKLMLFVLSDGQKNEGYSLNRISPIISGLGVPVYSIAYNYEDESGELDVLSDINEADVINANSDDIVNKLRNLFNAEI